MADEIPVRNPRNGEIDYSIPLTAAADITALADSLRTAQRDWCAAGVEARIAELRAFSEALEARRDDIVTALAADTGRHVLALGELDGLRRGIERWCAQAPTLLETAEVPSTAMPAVGLRRQLDPYPLVGVISPWNFPLLLSFIDAVPALLAGCAVIIKPSEVTPRFAAPVGEAIAAVPGLQRVLRFISGDGRAGAALVPAVDVVAFTGSVATGPQGRRGGGRGLRARIPRTRRQGPCCRIAGRGPGARGNCNPACLRIRHRPGLPVARAHLRARIRLRHVRLRD